MWGGLVWVSGFDGKSKRAEDWKLGFIMLDVTVLQI